MVRMLRHKETGELFVYTSLLATLAELEPVTEDPVAKVIAEMAVGASSVVAQDIPEFIPQKTAKEAADEKAMKSAPGYMSNKDQGRKAK